MSATPQPTTTPNPTAKKKPDTETGRKLFGGGEKGNTENKGSKVLISSKSKKKITCFEDFDALQGKKETKPVVLYFYWPVDTDKKTAEQYKNCQKMNELLFRNQELYSAFSELSCYKVNLKNLDKARIKRYKVKRAPTLIFFDATGKKLKTVTSPRVSPVSLIRLIKTVLKTSEKNLKKAQEKKEKESAKNSR